MFAIQTDIAQRIAATLRPTVSRSGSAAMPQRPTSDLTAYDFELRARERLLEYSQDETDAALALFRQAIARDSAYASAHAGLALAFIDKLTLTGESAWGDSALAAGQRAIELDPTLADGYASVGYAYFYGNDFPAAYRWYLEAIERNPSHARALSGLAGTAYWLGRFDESIRWSRKGAAVDPRTPHHRQQVGMGYLELGLVDEAEYWFEEALKLKPDLPYAYVFLARIAVSRGQTGEATRLSESGVAIAARNPWILGQAGSVALMSGNLEQARRYYERSIGVAPDSEDQRLVELAYISLARGDTAAAENFLGRSARQTKARQQAGERSWLTAYESARRSLLEGHDEAALNGLEEAYRRGWRDHFWNGQDPLLESLGGQPPFDRLINRIRDDKAGMRQSLQGESST